MLLTLRYLGESELPGDPRLSVTGEPPRRVRLVVAYDGSSFHGFARNPGVVTVAGVLEAHLARVLRHPVVVTGAGRTDKGVHAWGQVITFDTTAPHLDLPRLQRSINSVCGPAIAVRDIGLVAPDFDARFSATWRRYHYTILNSATPNPFLTAVSWHLPLALDVEAMTTAGQALLGSHDFSSFCRRPPSRPGGPPISLDRTVLELAWQRLDDDVLRMDVRARAFCHQMVRSIVGTLVDVGRGQIAADAIPQILAARTRSAAGDLAPPHGLCLREVGYDPTSDAG